MDKSDDEFERIFKYFKTSIDHEELNLIDYKVNFQSRWFFTCEPYEPQSELYIYGPNFLQSKMFQNYNFKILFTNLKRLNMGYSVLESNGFNLEVLNDLKSLEQLEIHCLSLESKKTLSLPNLKLLLIDKLKRTKKSLLTVDSAELKVFFCSQNLDLIKFEHPNSIEHLYLKSNSNKQNLTIFSNLKIFCYEQIFIKKNEQPLLIDLKSLPNLEELHCVEYIDTSGQNDYLEKRLDFLRNLMTKRDMIDKEMRNKVRQYEDDVIDPQIEKKTFKKRFNLLITYFGCNLKDKDELKYEIAKYNKKIFSLDYELDDVYLSYSLISSSLKYSESIDFQRIQRNYLHNLNILYIYKKNNENDLIDLIKKCVNLRFLTLKDTLVSQEFLDQLPIICTLNRFNFENEDTELRVDFKFITHFKYLKCFLTDRQLTSDNFLHFFTELRSLNEIQFKSESGAKLKIEKTDRDKYQILIFDLQIYGDLFNAKLFKKLENSKNVEDTFRRLVKQVYIKIQKNRSLNQLADLFEKIKRKDPQFFRSLKKRLKPLVRRALVWCLKKLFTAVVVQQVINAFNLLNLNQLVNYLCAILYSLV